MKLALPLLLLALALCCPDANAKICPALNSVMSTFLLGTKALYNENLQQFDAPAEARQAVLQVKTCVDKLSKFDRLTMAHFVKIINYECNKQVS